MIVQEMLVLFKLFFFTEADNVVCVDLLGLVRLQATFVRVISGLEEYNSRAYVFFSCIVM